MQCKSVNVKRARGVRGGGKLHCACGEQHAESRTLPSLPPHTHSSLTLLPLPHSPSLTLSLPPSLPDSLNQSTRNLNLTPSPSHSLTATHSLPHSLSLPPLTCSTPARCAATYRAARGMSRRTMAVHAAARAASSHAAVDEASKPVGGRRMRRAWLWGVVGGGGLCHVCVHEGVC